MADTKKILVIDDDEALCNALTTKFSNKGYEVTASRDGEEAIVLLDTEEYDVIITDLHMPVKDGFDVLEKIKTSKNAGVPAYVITNLGTDQFCEKALQLGAKQCFVKSLITLRDVVDIVDNEMHGK